MDTDREKLHRSAEDSRKHFTIPEGYFESLEERIMAHIDAEPLPQEFVEEPKRNRIIWQHLRPYLYLAASFVLTIGAFRGFQYVRSTYLATPEVEMKAQSTDLEDLQYYQMLAGEYTDDSDFETMWLVNTNYVN